MTLTRPLASIRQFTSVCTMDPLDLKLRTSALNLAGWQPTSYREDRDWDGIHYAQHFERWKDHPGVPTRIYHRGWSEMATAVPHV